MNTTVTRTTTQLQRTNHPLIAHIFSEQNERLNANLKPETSPELVNELYKAMDSEGIIEKYKVDNPGMSFL